MADHAIGSLLIYWDYLSGSGSG